MINSIFRHRSRFKHLFRCISNSPLHLAMLGAQSQRSVSAIGLGLLLFCLIAETSASRISLICSPYATSECLTATAEIQRAISARPTGATVSFASINYTLPNAIVNITDLSTSQSAADTTLAISLLCSDAISLALSTATNVRFTNRPE
jgi:hypothetical protein